MAENAALEPPRAYPGGGPGCNPGDSERGGPVPLPLGAAPGENAQGEIEMLITWWEINSPVDVDRFMQETAQDQEATEMDQTTQRPGPPRRPRSATRETTCHPRPGQPGGIPGVCQGESTAGPPWRSMWAPGWRKTGPYWSAGLPPGAGVRTTRNAPSTARTALRPGWSPPRKHPRTRPRTRPPADTPGPCSAT